MPHAHDVGGNPAHNAPIDREEHEAAMWEVCVSALSSACRKAGVFNLDEMRRAIENIPPDRYAALEYYERWTVAMESLLIQKGILTLEEIDAKLAEIG